MFQVCNSFSITEVFTKLQRLWEFCLIEAKTIRIRTNFPTMLPFACWLHHLGVYFNVFSDLNRRGRQLLHKSKLLYNSMQPVCLIGDVKIIILAKMSRHSQVKY